MTAPEVQGGCYEPVGRIIPGAGCHGRLYTVWPPRDLRTGEQHSIRRAWLARQHGRGQQYPIRGRHNQQLGDGVEQSACRSAAECGPSRGPALRGTGTYREPASADAGQVGANLEDLTAPLPQPQYMTQSLQNPVSGAGNSMARPTTSGLPSMAPLAPVAPATQQLPDSLPPAQYRTNPASLPAPANPFGTAPPVRRPITARAPAAWPPPPGQSVPLTGAAPLAQAAPASPAMSAERGPVLLTSSTADRTPLPTGARLASGIDAAPIQAPTQLMLPSASQTTEAHKMMAQETRDRLRQPEPAIENAPTTAAGIRLINGKRFSLAYAVKDVGRSGLAGVELWYTQDGRTWQKHPSPLHHHSPYVIEVGDEDLYGFTLVAHSGSGVTMHTPQPGDLPQVWVEVDVTSPVVRLLGVEPGTGDAAGTVSVLWSATDKHLGPTPIRLAYAERPDGPWQTIAEHVANTGRYVWTLTPGVPLQFYVRVQAVDEAGNVGEVQTAQPIVGDLAQPSIAILGVAPAIKR